MRKLWAGMLVAAGFLAASAVQAADLKDGTTSFKVIREGDQIGTHTVTARHEGGDLVLDIAVDIKVKVAFITAYRYEQTRREVWRDGKLIAFESDTNDDGKKAKTSGKLEGDMLVVTGPGGTHKVRPDIIPNSWWNPDLAKQSELLSTFDSTVLKVKVEDAGEESVETSTGPVKAHRYVLTGEAEREVWYDAEGRWVHMRTGRGGTPVDWVLQ
ncbi:MAG TPA: DUF6134 family protein [Methylomirabilota bacterium]|jgi:uncharacterized protein DUF6134|nr:DUF6134 family protein [Methylomirabilota bacterium]